MSKKNDSIRVQKALCLEIDQWIDEIEGAIRRESPRKHSKMYLIIIWEDMSIYAFMNLILCTYNKKLSTIYYYIPTKIYSNISSPSNFIKLTFVTRKT